MKFTIIEHGNLPQDALYDGVVDYLTNMKRHAGDSVEDVKLKVSISYNTSRTVYCRPCDVEKLYERTLIYYGSNLIDPSHHKTTENILSRYKDRSGAAIIVITASDYAMNLAMGYFRSLGRPAAGDSVSFKWMREYTIEEARFKIWHNNDIAAAMADLAVLMTKVGVRTDTFLGATINGSIIEMSNEGIRKARQRKPSFSL